MRLPTHIYLLLLPLFKLLFYDQSEISSCNFICEKKSIINNVYLFIVEYNRMLQWLLVVVWFPATNTSLEARTIPHLCMSDLVTMMISYDQFGNLWKHLRTSYGQFPLCSETLSLPFRVPSRILRPQDTCFQLGQTVSWSASLGF